MVLGASLWRADCFLEESTEGRIAFYEQQGKTNNCSFKVSSYLNIKTFIRSTTVLKGKISSLNQIHVHFSILCGQSQNSLHLL